WDSCADPAEIFRQLRCERSGLQLRERKSLEVVLPGEPAAILYEIALHVSGERNGSAKAEGAESQEVQKQVSHRARDNVVVGRLRCRSLASGVDLGRIHLHQSRLTHDTAAL